MKIAVISDSHDNRTKFKQAATLAKQLDAEAILHCGDIVAPSTLKEAKDTDLPIHAIHGNNVGDLIMMNKIASKPENNISFYGQDAAIKLADKKIFIVHYPHYAKALALTGDYDLVCYGHDHTYYEEIITSIKNSQCLLANPGSVAGLDGPASFMIIDLSDMSVEKLLLD